ncbi:MAG: 3,4-dihydroxy-2-butanone-4-phosphate synthase [Flavobacteriaceae bacterium]|nr:3,4-dihydroxy-2-butanone-4-phosphate synthase [Flavobacteriaceae bacterium]
MKKADTNNTLNSITEAIEDIKKGKVVIVVDDEDRENEGDFIAAAEMVTPEMINFMATHGRGLICAPITGDRCKKLGLSMMVKANTVLHETPFTVSVDLKGHGCTTGISVSDRSKTIKSLVSEDTKPSDLGRPGHIFPLRAKKGGVLRRTGHTEASIDLARLAGLKPAGILVEILKEDGSMARMPDLKVIAKKFDLKIISIEDLVSYRMRHDSLIEKIEDFEITTKYGSYRLRAYRQTTNGNVHFSLSKGIWEKDESILVKVLSSGVEDDILSNLLFDTKDKLDSVFGLIEKRGKGVVVFIKKKTNSETILRKLKLFKRFGASQEDIVKSVQKDDKDFGIGAQILHNMGISKISVISEHKRAKQRIGITGYGLEVTEYVSY